MSRRNQKTILYIVLYFVLVVGVGYLRIAAAGLYSDAVLLSVQYICYCLMVFAWALSVMRRLYHPQIRFCFYLLIAAFILLLMIRGLSRIVFAGVYPYEHLLWYFFYVPDLALPLISYYMTQYVGENEDYRMPKQKLLLLIPWFLLCAGIMTNEWHQLAFRFEERGVAVSLTGPYHVSTLYYLAHLWLFGIAVLSVYRLFRKFKRSGLHAYVLFPGAFLLIGLSYSVWYALDRTPAFLSFIGSTAVSIFSTMGIWEASLMMGLIPSNRDYDLYFQASNLPMTIRDLQGHTVYSSAGKKADEAQGVRFLRDREFEIDGGVCSWQEDVTGISAMIRTLSENAETLRDINSHLEQQARIKRETAQAKERARLYDRALHDMKKQIALARELAVQSKTLPEEEARDMLARVSVLSAYIKRRSNLILMEEQEEMLPLRELHFCLRESNEALALVPVSCVYTQEIDSDLPVSSYVIRKIYDMFEREIEAVLQRMDRLKMRLTQQGDLVELHLWMVGKDMPGQETRFAMQCNEREAAT